MSNHSRCQNSRCPTIQATSIHQFINTCLIWDVQHLEMFKLRCLTIWDVKLWDVQQFKMSNNSSNSSPTIPTKVPLWNTQKSQLIIYSKYFVPGYDWQKSTWIHCQIKDYGISFKHGSITKLLITLWVQINLNMNMFKLIGFMWHPIIKFDIFKNNEKLAGGAKMKMTALIF